MSLLTAQEDTQKWEPTHVQVTVLRGRGLRGKGKHGTSDVYAVIQLGKEKYSTCVLDKTTEPEWREECSFELQSGVLQQGSGPLPGNQLLLTVMHRALIGMDVFLGQTTIHLDQVFQESRGVKNRWFRLNSKTGKKEKERGDIQVTVQFTRNNLTASMYDLVMKDKGFSTFTKLKERMRGKRRSSDEDSSSVTLPGGYGSLCRMRHRLPSDGGGEEDYEDDEGGEVRRSKMRNFFLRGKLRKSSDTRSSTSLGSESSESSSRGGSLSPTAGISVVVSDLSNSPSNSSNLTTDNSPEHTANTSPKSSSFRCDFGEEAGDITIAVPRPTVCVNGSHDHKVQVLDWGSGKSENFFSPGLLQKSSPLSMSLQNLSPRTSTDPHTGPVGDGRRWSFDKPCMEEKAAIVAALEQSGPMISKDEEEEEEMLAASSKSESGSQGRKQRKKLFSSGSGKSTGRVEDQPDSTSTGNEEKHKGWFGLEESRKLSPPVSSPESESLSGSPVSLSSLFTSGLHTNPFCQSEATPPPFSPSNPFFSSFHHNPFHQEVLTPQSLNPTVPRSPILSSFSSSQAQLFPESPINLTDQTATPAPPPGVTEEEDLLNWSLSNPFMSPRNLEADSEWDEDFKAFATGRLQFSEDLKSEFKSEQRAFCERSVENCNNQDQPVPAIVQNTNSPQLHMTFFSKAHDDITTTNVDHVDTFADVSEKVLEPFSSESHNLDKTLKLPADSTDLDVCAFSNTNTDDLNNSGKGQLKGTSPDPRPFDLGSSAEEDFLNSISSYSGKISQSSSAETEGQNILGHIQGFENSFALTFADISKPSKFEGEVTERSHDQVCEVEQLTVLQQKNSNDKVECDKTQPQSPEPSGQEDAEVRPEETISELRPESKVWSQSTVNQREENCTRFDKSPVSRHMEMFPSPGGGVSSTPPLVNIFTSSPDTRQIFQDFGSSTLEGKSPDLSHKSSPVMFGGFGDTCPELEDGNSLLQPQASNHSSSSFLQSLYVSVDSQKYQTCESSEFFAVSDSNTELHSVNSTLCGDLSDLQTPVSGVPDSTMPSKLSDTEQSVSAEAEDWMNSFNADFSSFQPFGSQGFSKLFPESEKSYSPARTGEDRVKNQFVVLDKEFSQSPQVQSTTLHCFQSEDAQMQDFDELLLLPASAMDPSLIQEFSSAEPDLPFHFESFSERDPNKDQGISSARSDSPVPCLASFSPSLTSCSSLPTLYSYFHPAEPSPMDTAVLTPEEMKQQEVVLQNSPHPVKPMATEEKKSEGRSVLEKLKSTISPGRSSQVLEQETDRKKCLTEGAGSYYHLTHSQLVALLLQREAELQQQKTEFGRQKVLLAKREAELKRLKPQVRDLEDYIDTLLVRIMEQKPTLLQVRSRIK